HHLFLLQTTPRRPMSTLFPYTTLFRSNGSLESLGTINRNCDLCLERICHHFFVATRSETQSYGAEFLCSLGASGYLDLVATKKRSEEHTSELQSPDHLVCSLLI